MIVFGPEAFELQRVGGISRCMLDLMRGLGDAGVAWNLWAGRHGNLYLDELGQEDPILPRIKGGRMGPLPGRRYASFAGEYRFAQFIKHSSARIVHRTQYPLVDMLPRSMPMVATLHDMWSERSGGPRGERWKGTFKRRALERATRIVCISQATRDEMVFHWPWLEDKAVVIHHGVNRVSDFPVPPTRDRPFFLFVGVRHGKKNCAVALKALSQSPRLQAFDLICIGGGPLTPEEQQDIAAMGLAGRVIQATVGDAALAGLYEAAAALLYPTKHEGFGMPMLEAMIHGCPAIVSPLSCLPEIGGDAALYAAAESADEWCAQMETMAFDTAEREHRRRLGFARAEHFTWARSAQAHQAVYNSIAPTS